MTNIDTIDDDTLEQKLSERPAPRVTKDYIKSRILEVGYTRFSPTITICEITLDNGYSVRGESACVNVENYDAEIGQRIAHDNAFSQLWPLFGFLLAEEQYKGLSTTESE